MTDNKRLFCILRYNLLKYNCFDNNLLKKIPTYDVNTDLFYQLLDEGRDFK